jgi:hypothetical protein
MAETGVVLAKNLRHNVFAGVFEETMAPEQKHLGVGMEQSDA